MYQFISTSTNLESNDDFDGLVYPASGDALLLRVRSPFDELTSFNEPWEYQINKVKTNIIVFKDDDK